MNSESSKIYRKRYNDIRPLRGRTSTTNYFSINIKSLCDFLIKSFVISWLIIVAVGDDKRPLREYVALLGLFKIA